MGGAAIAALAMIAYAFFRPAVNPEEEERKRRLDLIQMETALAFLFFGINSGTEEGISDHGQRGDRRATHGKHQFPIGKQSLQRANSPISNPWDCARHAER